MPEIRLLGPFEVRVGDEDVTPRRQKQRALLAALALRAGTPATPDRLVDELWGEEAPKTARHALENYVFELRKALGKDVIQTRPNGYLLALPSDDVDVLRFQRLLADARHAPPPERAHKLREALALVRGEPLVDLAFEPFARAEIPRLLDLEVGAREDLIDAELEEGHGAELIADLERLVGAHPFRERLRAQLMVALYRAGRQAEALEAYQSARRTLVDELGIDPSEDLQELERAILRQDPRLRPPPRPADERPLPVEQARRPMRKTVTVLHAALANAATLAERLDAEPLRAILDRYLAGARATVGRHEGQCSLVSGTTVEAVFGIPTAHEDDALRAVRAAVELREAIGLLNDGLFPEHGVFLELRIGIDTGEVLATGDAERPTGRAVAGAELLERAAEGGQILLGGSTHGLVKQLVETEESDLGDEAHEPRRAYRLVELQADTYGRALRLDSPIVGRRRQLAALSSAFERAASERTLHLFTLLGPAGVGKSRLARELVEGLAGVARVLHGRCLPYGEGITYLPLLEALREDDGAPDELDMTPEGARRALESLARDQPLVFVLDDVQWAEAPLLDLVEAVADSSRGAPILVLCVARLELLDTRPTWSGGKHNASSLLLEPLSEAAAERLIDNLLGDSDLADPVRDYIVRSAEGNPLFLEELLAALVDREILLKQAGRWTTTEVPAIPVPPSIQALVAARVDRLPAEERRVLELAAVEGKEFSSSGVAELSDEDVASQLESHLAALVRKELVRPGADAGTFEFRHQVIRDAAYASLPMQERIGLHEALARWLDRQERAAAEESFAAYHLDQAARYRRTLGLPEGARPAAST